MLTGACPDNASCRMSSIASISMCCGYAGGDAYGDSILGAAEDQIFASNSSILATLANMTSLAVSTTCPAFKSSTDVENSVHLSAGQPKE